MAERGLSMIHMTIMRWVHRYASKFERRWNRFTRPVGHSLRVDKTYVGIRVRRIYRYRAVDREGKIEELRLSASRDVGAAKVFFREVIKGQGSTPESIKLRRLLCGVTSRRARDQSLWWIA
jgi:transposase-like protein